MTTLSYHHRFIPGSDPSAPPLLLLHGTGGDENDLIPLGQKLSPGSALLSPRGDVLEQGMPRFFRRLAEGVFDLTEVAARAEALADFIASAAGHYRLDQKKLTAVGFSNGANIAASVLLLRPESLAGAILLRPMIVLQPKEVSDLSGKRILISSGKQDPIVPDDHPAGLAQLFRRAGASVTLRAQAAGHSLVPADVSDAQKFLTGD
jgi:phospholipase/carboxylesterase